jgi:hypothetical protein
MMKTRRIRWPGQMQRAYAWLYWESEKERHRKENLHVGGMIILK